LSRNQVLKVATQCFWCGASGVMLSRDHVVPVCNGGNNNNNLVAACNTCQQQRSTLTSYWMDLKKLKQYASYNNPSPLEKVTTKGLTKALKKKKDSILLLLATWTQIEMDKLGRSPSKDLGIAEMLLSHPKPIKSPWMLPG